MVARADALLGLAISKESIEEEEVESEVVRVPNSRIGRAVDSTLPIT